MATGRLGEGEDGVDLQKTDDQTRIEAPFATRLATRGETLRGKWLEG